MQGAYIYLPLSKNLSHNSSSRGSKRKVKNATMFQGLRSKIKIPKRISNVHNRRLRIFYHDHNISNPYLYNIKYYDKKDFDNLNLKYVNDHLDISYLFQRYCGKYSKILDKVKLIKSDETLSKYPIKPLLENLRGFTSPRYRLRCYTKEYENDYEYNLRRLTGDNIEELILKCLYTNFC